MSLLKGWLKPEPEAEAPELPRSRAPDTDE